jgi:hypothetical protein
MFMNSPNVRGYATAFAQLLAEEAGDDLGKAVIAGYRAALGRAPDAREVTATLAFLKSQKEAYATARQNNPQLLALVDLAQTIFSLNEFTYLR